MRQFSLFGGLAAEDVDRLSEQVSERQHPAGTLLFEAGQPVEGFYLICSGAVKVYKLSPEGKEQILNVFQAGESFAEAAVFQGMRGYPASAQCLHDSVLVFVARDVLLGQIARTPELAFRLLAGMARKLRLMVGLVEDLTLRDARGRLCRYLLTLLTPGEPDLTLPFAQTVLARMLGITQETMSRTLKALQDEEILQSSGPGQFRILQPEVLELVGGGI